MEILKVNELKKHYGSVRALDGISFSVPQGSVFGILGPNGSGKTTLLGIIMDVLKATSGSYLLFGKTGDAEARKNIGTLLETPNFYHYLSAVENLKIVASIKEKDESDINRVLNVVNLSERKHYKFSTYSLGMKQRLAIASALLGDPKVLVLDEPTNGLDPSGISETRKLIKELNKLGKTIIMASHLLDEVEKVCTHVAILKRGNILAHGSVDELFGANNVIELQAADNNLIIQNLTAMPGFISQNHQDNVVFVTINPNEITEEGINKFFFEKGIVLRKINLKKESLERKFMELTN